ncbi:glycosyltransferase [Nocardioides marmoribigeumensis]|uniref:UDP:flavonoid glycosyltransferase YjiC (YdhE family) n=1 Tax=Nocardioides marmoribigeumensis TaxID=433649 RepID=A0ABU2BR22_9ACTN|nr:glycosyltransferase [Nocardioides marmoribigeumensis]MDR7361062.1 UDP:flavonoid glycosyltransferase YjiC (YdhE family) [Nocardioides marmoribigeumensis]
MAEILVVTWDGGGNVPPATGIARELLSRGHRVRFVGHRAQHRSLVDAGFEVAPSPRSRDFSGVQESSPVTMARTFSDRGLARDVIAALDARPADLVVVDCLLMGVLEAVRAHGTPYVVLEHLYDASYRSLLRGPIGLGMRLHGLRPGRALAGAAARLVASVPELDPSGERAGIEHVGPVVEWSPRVPGDPAVLVSLSTFAYPGMADCLQRLLDATAGLEARVVVTTGPVVDPASLRTAANHEVHRFVPHAELMPHMSLVVGHGGHSTTMRALAHDLPLVVMPMHPMVDQPVVGRSVARAGAGRVVPKAAPAKRVRPVIEDLLADGPHRAAAARLGEAVRARPGARRAADRVEDLVSHRRPGVPFGT